MLNTKKIMFIRIFFVCLSIHIAMATLLPCHMWAIDTSDAYKDTSQTKNTPKIYSLQGYISTKYVFRTTHISGERVSDHDLYEQMRFDLTMPQEERYEFHFFATAREDVDGDQDSKYYFPFEDIGNTLYSSSTGYLYEAHFDMNHLFPYLTQIRVGRQASNRDEPFFFDGLAADIEASRKLNLTVYGGVAVHFYEIDHDWGTDSLSGIAIDYSPFEITSLSLDYLYVHDKRNLFSDSDQDDQLISFKVWQRFYSFLKAMTRLRYVNDEARDIKVRVVNTFIEADTELSVSYFRQLNTQKELSNEFSSYYDVLGESFPYHSFDLKVRKLFGPHYALDIGYFQRELIGSREESAFNRGYKRIFTILDMNDILYDGLSFSLIGEYWKTNEKEFNSAGLDIGYKFSNGIKGAKINGGTYYSLYKYDYYIERGERDEVQTYYVKGNFPVSRHFSANGSYEYEDSIEDYQTFKLGMRYDF